jgi:hypothetical protein
MMKKALSTTWVFLAAVLGCSSHGGQTSSSSHWVACATAPECASVTGAVACEQGYCVDANHQRIESGGVTTGPSVCDPLAPHELPITMGMLLGAGMGLSQTDVSQGPVYAADHVADTSTDRVFVSMGDTLYRRRVLGSGSSGGAADVDYTFTFEDGAGERSLMIQRRGGKVTGVALGGGGKEFIGDAGATGSLAVVDDATIATMKLRNLPGEVTIEYVADVENGSVIVVTHPRDDYGYSDFRLFHGPQNGLIEYPVLDVLRTRGSDTTIRFSEGGAELTAHFSWVFDPGDDGGISSHPGPATLDAADGKTLSVTQRTPTPASLPGSAFTCLH